LAGLFFGFLNSWRLWPFFPAAQQQLPLTRDFGLTARKGAGIGLSGVERGFDLAANFPLSIVIPDYLMTV
jgi:hypothetical protein